jgi:hypothetical protein
VCHVKHLSGPATEDEAVQAIHDRFRELNPHEAAHAMRVTVDGRTRWFVANGTIVAMSTCVQTPCPKGPGVDTDSDTG